MVSHKDWLGPLLFLIYNNEINIVLFANDTSCIGSHSDIMISQKFCDISELHE